MNESYSKKLLGYLKKQNIDEKVQMKELIIKLKTRFFSTLAEILKSYSKKKFKAAYIKFIGFKHFKHIEGKIKLFCGRNFYGFWGDYFFDNLNFYGLLAGLDEFKLTKFLIKRLRPNDIFYDIGANYGFFTILAQELGVQEIHSFEPNSEIFRFLQKNADLSNYKNTYLNNTALSNFDGKVNLNIYSNISGYSSIVADFVKERKNTNFIGCTNTILVDCATLDSYTSVNHPPTVIKIDVEGAEFLVLEGCENLLKTNKPIVIIETFKDDRHKKAVTYLLEKGYSAFDIDQNGNLAKIENPLFNIFDNNFDEYCANLVFINKEKSNGENS